MQMCARLVQDDLAIMMEKPDGQYYLLAGSILLPGFWRLEDKFGMPLSEIHTSGDVPQFREKLEKGMMNFFRRLRPEEMVARNNYFIQVDDDLAWSWSIGDEDAADVSWSTAEKNRAVEHHWFRSERQTSPETAEERRGCVYDTDLFPSHHGSGRGGLCTWAACQRHQELGGRCKQIQRKGEVRGGSARVPGPEA